MMDQIKLIAFISLAVIAIAIVIALFKKGSKDRILAELEQLQVAFNEIRTTPLSMKFNTAQAVAKRNDETDKEIKEYYSRYTATQSVIDEVDNILINVENYKQDHNYKAIKQLIPELKEKINVCIKEIKETDQFLKKYEHKDTEQRSYSTNLKQQFQVIRDTIRKNANQLSISYDAINARLDACSSLFTRSEDAMYAGDYITAQEALETIEKDMRNIKKVVNEIPSIVKETTVIIPSMIEEAGSSSGYIKQKGAYIDHLQVKFTIDKVSSELKECVELASKLEIDGLMPKIQDVKNEIKTLNEALANEDKQFLSAKQNMEEIQSVLTSIANTIDIIQSSADANENLYSSNTEKPNTEEHSNRMINIKTTYLDLAARLEMLSEPVSALNERIESTLIKAHELQEDLSLLKDGLDKNVGDVQRAKANLTKFQLVVNQAEISVRASHLPSISDSFSADLAECKNRIRDIKMILEQETVDLTTLNTKIRESMDFIYGFSNNVKNLVGLSIMTENAIVFGNKFRSSHREIDSDLSKSEFSFLNGEYTKAVQLAIKTMDTLYPDQRKDFNSVNN